MFLYSTQGELDWDYCGKDWFQIENDFSPNRGPNGLTLNMPPPRGQQEYYWKMNHSFKPLWDTEISPSEISK